MTKQTAIRFRQRVEANENGWVTLTYDPACEICNSILEDKDQLGVDLYGLCLDCAAKHTVLMARRA